MISRNTPNKLSRRNWLRTAAITSTGAVVLPSLLTGCSYIDDVLPGLGSEPPESDLYKAAAQNLLNMSEFVDSLLEYTFDYENRVFENLKGGKKPTNWTHILVEMFIDIGVGILEGALEEFPGAGPAFAAGVTQLEKWGSKESEGKVNASIDEFRDGYNEMMKQLSSNLLHLGSNDNDYAALKEAFKEGDLEFNGQKYSLSDLAQKHFPIRTKSEDSENFKVLREAAYLAFKRNIWFAMFLKAGKLETEDLSWEDFCNDSCHPTNYAEQFYKDNPAAYLRGYYYRSVVTENNSYLYYRKWYFTFDGLELPLSATKILFRDSYPGKVINPNALFTRDVVFKQFVREKTDFMDYYEIRKDDHKGPCEDVNMHHYQRCAYFDPEGDNYEYIAGDFRKLPEIMEELKPSDGRS